MASVFLHLRFLHAYFLMPVYLFALVISPNFTERQLLWSFVIIHLLLYPASNGYNRFFSQYTNAVDALKNPPALYFFSILLHAVALALGWLFFNTGFALLILIYGLVAIAYSYRGVWLKEYPIVGWLARALFQGALAFMMCYVGINNYPLAGLLKAKVLIPAALCALMFVAICSSMETHLKRGLRGHLFVLITFLMATITYLLYFHFYFSDYYGIVFIVAFSPIVLFFLYGVYKYYRTPEAADYGHTIGFIFLAATCFNAFFIWMFLRTTNLLQL